ncbi:DUF4189 domain-containing protein [Nocardia sp. NPDC050406]|uniref:DUF4189 domain-containing protein n=1 Tax=Nocardia sp. NPDC050406 TaxID=3364318 RepID=UPI0037B5E25A
MKKIVSGAAVVIAAAGSLLVGTAAPAKAYGVNYGAIAHSVTTGSIAWSYDYPDSASARSAALGDCIGGDCKIVARYSNGCGAIAHAPGWYSYGAANSLSAAKSQAIRKNNGGASIVHWSCTSGYQL